MFKEHIKSYYMYGVVVDKKGVIVADTLSMTTNYSS